MKTQRPIVTTVLVAILLLIGCATQPPLEVHERPEEAEVSTEPPEEPAAATPAPTAGPNREASSANSALPDVRSAPTDRPNRLIVKNAELKLLVEDSDVAIDRVMQTTGDLNGYIISSRMRYDEWQGEEYKYASITLGVPVDRFETAMRRLRSIALRVEDETASGQDVTDEYVDLQSRLDSLKATRDRIRQFLDQAQTVEESLRVNEQLSAIEEEIEQVRGRMNYLFDRSTYSTITVQINPQLPQPEPTPMPTPKPQPAHWSNRAFQNASHALSKIVQTVGTTLIWFGIVVVPLTGPLALVWLIRRRATYRRRKQNERRDP